MIYKSSVAVGWGLGRDRVLGDLGFGRGVSLSPVLTSFFILSVKSAGGGLLESAESWVGFGLVESGSSLLLRLECTFFWGGAKMAVVKSPPLSTAVFSVQSLSQAVVVLLPSTVFTVAVV